jgi:hypothetical protein
MSLVANLKCFEFVIEATLVSQQTIELYIKDSSRESALARVNKSLDVVAAFITAESPIAC